MRFEALGSLVDDLKYLFLAQLWRWDRDISLIIRIRFTLVKLLWLDWIGLDHYKVVRLRVVNPTSKRKKGTGA